MDTRKVSGWATLIAAIAGAVAQSGVIGGGSSVAEWLAIIAVAAASVGHLVSPPLPPTT